MDSESCGARLEEVEGTRGPGRVHGSQPQHGDQPAGSTQMGWVGWGQVGGSPGEG